jgi:hypothetical protein
MKNTVLTLCGGLLLAGFVVLPAAHAASAEARLVADNSFTESVKEGYEDLKDSVKETFGGYTGDDREDARNYMERRQDDLKKYHDTVREARKDYIESRQNDREAYLKHHKELPQKEDINADLDLSKIGS